MTRTQELFELLEERTLNAFKLAKAGTNGCDTAEGGCLLCIDGLIRRLERSVAIAREMQAAEEVQALEDEDTMQDVEDGFSDVEADADTLASAGWGTDEDYGYYGEED